MTGYPPHFELPLSDRYRKWLNDAAQTFADPAHVRDELVKLIDRLRAEENEAQEQTTFKDFGR